MSLKIKIILGIVIVGIIALVAVNYFGHVDVAVLNPHGQIADQQRSLIIFTLELSLIVVIPVISLLFIFAWKYREGNAKATYTPEWDSNKFLEGIWWGIPCAVILTLSIITWRTSHELDPYRSIASNNPPLHVQVVALQWKWLFIYPEKHIASVNFLDIPEKTPIDFSITADAPMNSFWIPSLGSQVYAMSGMSTQLHLLADQVGEYHGSSANISGRGFASMAFTVQASTEKDFTKWVYTNQHVANYLNFSNYNLLARSSTISQPLYYSLQDELLYDKIIMKYMSPTPSNVSFNNPRMSNDKSIGMDTQKSSRRMG